MDAILTTERLVLRDWQDDDLPAFAQLNADERVMHHFPATLNREQSDAVARRFRENIADQGFGFWAVGVVDGPPFIGFVGLSRPRFEAHFTPCVEIGWRLAHAHWGQGYATEAALTALAFGFDHLQLEEIVSFTVPANRASRRVMEKLGMTRAADEDFDHPMLEAGHPLRRHVLYRKQRPG